jgi:superfamily II DNA/RNA helicase
MHLDPIPLCISCWLITFPISYAISTLMASKVVPDQSPKPPTNKELCKLVNNIFKKQPCLFQLDIACALLSGKDVINAAATGLGKTLSFWIALLHWKKHCTLEELNKCIIVVTPLTVLSKQNDHILHKAGLKSVAINKDTLGDAQLFKVCPDHSNPHM